MDVRLMLISKEGCDRQINQLWRSAGFSGRLVWCESAIDAEIAYIRASAEMKHLHWIKTVDQYCSCFPSRKPGHGDIRLWGADEPELRDESLRAALFVLDHRLLFTKVSGLRHLQAEFGITVGGNELYNGHYRDKRDVSFAELPIRTYDPLYHLCARNDAAELWLSLCNYLSCPTNPLWLELRNLVVPGTGLDVGQLVECIRGKDMNRPLGSRSPHPDQPPSPFEVRLALQSAVKKAS